MRGSRAAAFLLGDAAAMLLLATLVIVPLAGPGTAATFDLDDGPGVVDSTDVSTTPSDVLENADAALEGEPVQAPESPPSPVGEATPVESPSIALAELVGVYPQLSEREQLEADALLARPDVPNNGVDLKTWSAAARSTADMQCGDHVCVHYVSTSDDAATAQWVSTNVDVLEDVWAYEVSTLGYRAPATDNGKGGNDKFDVYLANVGKKGYYGYCAPENFVPGQTGRAYAYCVLENNFEGFAGTPVDNLKVTAAHEFFHAVQYNYDFDEDRWLMEATATWMEEQYADSVNDNRQYLKYGQLGEPGKSLDTFDGLTHYGNWLFFEKLSQKYGVTAVRSLWNRLDASPGAPNQSSVRAIRKYLEARGTSLTKFYAHFAAGNLGPTRAYSEGSQYRATKFNDTYQLNPGHKAIAWQQAKLRHLTSKSYRFKAASSLPGKWKLRILVDAPADGNDPGAVAYIYAQNGKLTKKFIKLNKSGVGSTTVKFSPAKIRRVTLSLANASTRSNASEFAFRVTAVR